MSARPGFTPAPGSRSIGAARRRARSSNESAARERNGEKKTLEESVDVHLRRDLMEHYPNKLSGKDAKKWEKKVTSELRSEGHIVFSN